jgi:hypothetical protein
MFVVAMLQLGLAGADGLPGDPGSLFPTTRIVARGSAPFAHQCPCLSPVTPQAPRGRHRNRDRLDACRLPVPPVVGDALAFVGLILVVSCPSMLPAYWGLRARNLGPILEGNVWAVESLVTGGGANAPDSKQAGGKQQYRRTNHRQPSAQPRGTRTPSRHRLHPATPVRRRLCRPIRALEPVGSR